MLFTVIKQLIGKIFFFALHVSPSGNFPPPLSKKKEEELVLKCMEGDINARNTLVEHNLRLVMHITKKYNCQPHQQDDLFSIGTIGLIKGVSSFNPQKGNKLATYVARCIENEILMFFRADKKRALDLHIQDAIDTDKDGNVLTLSDILSDDTDILSAIDRKTKLQKLGGVIEKALTPREKEIITMRYGLNGTKVLTQHEIAKKFGISRSYVSRIETSALKKLKNYF